MYILDHAVMMQKHSGVLVETENYNSMQIGIEGVYHSNKYVCVTTTHRQLLDSA